MKTKRNEFFHLLRQYLTVYLPELNILIKIFTVHEACASKSKSSLLLPAMIPRSLLQIICKHIIYCDNIQYVFCCFCILRV